MLDKKMLEKEIIDTYLGVPYLHLGRNKKGFDCWGIIIDIFRKKLDIKIFDLLDMITYKEMWGYDGEDDYVKDYSHEMDWQKFDNPKFLDIILFSNCKDVPNHAGIYLSKNKFLHCAGKVGAVVTKLEKRWEARANGFYRCRGLKDVN